MTLFNKQLTRQEWQHVLTNALYRIYSDGYATEPYVQFTLDENEGANREWRPSKEYPTVVSLIQAIEERTLVLKFTPDPDDLDGIRHIRNLCLAKRREISQTKEAGTNKRQAGERAGMLAAFHLIFETCEKYLAGVKVAASKKPIGDLIEEKVEKMRAVKFAVGDRVVTTSDAGAKDWERSSIEFRNRAWGIHGVVTCVHNSHGECYTVSHDDGEQLACYEPSELEPSAPESHHQV